MVYPYKRKQKIARKKVDGYRNNKIYLNNLKIFRKLFDYPRFALSSYILINSFKES
jgi:hypothetical protein